MAEEEAIVRMGLDTGPLAVGLRGVERSMEKTGHAIKEQFSELGGEIAASLSLAGAIGLIENTFQKVQQITRASENAGVSTDFIQTIEAAGKAAGITGEAIEKMLNKFVQGLPAGSDVEKSFYDTADAIAAIEDPTERARMATEAFGKSGVKMIAILKDGKAGIQEMAEQFDRLSESEIKAVEDAHVRIEALQSKLTVWAGKFIHGVQMAGEYYGALIGGGDPKAVVEDRMDEESKAENAKKSAVEAEKAARAAQAEAEARNHIQAAVEQYNKHLQDITLKSSTASFEEKHAILEKRYAEAKGEMDAAKNDKDRVEAMTKMADLKQEMLDLEKKHTDEADKANKKSDQERDKEMRHLEQLADKRDKASHNLADARKAPYEFTLEDLAKSNGFESGDARDVVQLREWAKWNFMHGNFDKGEFQKDRAEEIFDQMAKDNPYLKNPYEKMIDELKKANDTLDDFWENGMPLDLPD